MKKCTLISLVICGVLGILFLVTGIVLHFESHKIIKGSVEKNLKLKNGSTAFENWSSPPATVYMQFWVFNVENAWKIIDGIEKPNVTQQGPYTYREVRTKKDIEFLSNDSLIGYRESKAYVFVPGMSVGPSNQTFTTVNLPILTVAAFLQKKSVPGFVLKLISAALSHEDERLFEEHTVHEFLWGYEEKTLEKINKITTKWLGYNFTTTVGLFTGPTKNGSDDGVYEIHTGTNDIQSVNEYFTWKNQTSLPYWKTKTCNMLNGTDGSMWHPFINKTERLYIFSSDICRSIYVDYSEATSVRGIDTYRFVPPPTVFMDHVKNPANAGFCVPACLGSGVLDVSGCKKAPIVISQPHFYQGAPAYIKAITGLHPGPQFSTFMDIEPYTGVSLKVAKKLQLNAKITKLEAFKDTANFNLTLFPMIWLNESAEVNEAGANKFKSAVYSPIAALKYGSYVAIAVGAALLLAVIIFLIVYFVRNKQPQDEPLIEQDVPRGDI